MKIQFDFLASCNEILDNFKNRNFKTVLTIIFTLLDKSAKDIYPTDLVKERFLKLFKENDDFIFWVGSGYMISLNKDITIGKTPFSDLLYGIRNELIHNAELSKISFSEDKYTFIRNPETEEMTFNLKFIFALFLVVCYLPCNELRLPKNKQLNFNGKIFNIDNIAGKGKNIAISEIENLHHKEIEKGKFTKFNYWRNRL